MSKVIWKPGALVSPVPPTIVTCGTPQKPNAITIAWTGIVNTIPPMTYISLRPERYSYEIIKQSGEFVINLTTSSMVKAVDFCGVRSGKTVNKLKQTSLSTEPSHIVTPPMLQQSPLSLECKVTQILPLGSHHMFLAEIVSVSVDQAYLDNQGKLHLDQAKLLTYSHGEYFELGKKMGAFGFSVRKKKVTRPK